MANANSFMNLRPFFPHFESVRFPSNTSNEKHNIIFEVKEIGKQSTQNNR